MIPAIFSKSANANKDAILEQLQNLLPSSARVLEIASGTGQHCLHFARHMPNIRWQPSDLDLDAFELSTTLKSAALENVEDPVVLDVLHWPNLRPKFDCVFSANCIHVMPPECLQSYITGSSKSLKPGGAMVLYGPFKYHGEFTTPSNEKFNEWLEETYEAGGIRDFEAVDELAAAAGLEFENDIAMPANNQFLVWRKL